MCACAQSSLQSFTAAILFDGMLRGSYFVSPLTEDHRSLDMIICTSKPTWHVARWLLSMGYRQETGMCSTLLNVLQLAEQHMRRLFSALSVIYGLMNRLFICDHRKYAL